MQESRAWAAPPPRGARGRAGRREQALSLALALGKSRPGHGPAEQAVWLVEFQDRRDRRSICPRVWASGPE